jgi:hypothetical protein
VKQGKELQQRVDDNIGAIGESLKEGAEPLVSPKDMALLMDTALSKADKLAILGKSRLGAIVREHDDIMVAIKEERTPWQRFRAWLSRIVG